MAYVNDGVRLRPGERGVGGTREGDGLTANGRSGAAYLKDNLREYGMLFALIGIVAFFFIILKVVPPNPIDFLSPTNITNQFLQNAYVIIMASGMLLVIVAGHIDLSVGSVAAFVGAVSAVLTVNMDWPVWAVIPASLVVGGVIGGAQGYWIA